jgi:hypothetical protein
VNRAVDGRKKYPAPNAPKRVKRVLIIIGSAMKGNRDVRPVCDLVSTARLVYPASNLSTIRPRPSKTRRRAGEDPVERLTLELTAIR